MRTASRRGAVALLAAVWAVTAAPPAAADPAGPTDYRTEVVGIDPAVAGFRVEVIGGDSFVLVEAGPGTTLEVIGYRGEPYLRFLPDGTVEENRNSPTTYYNRDRYGVVEPPASATADAVPDWHTVADDGSYAWHDHRTHWMNEARPPGREPGDVILEGVVPLVVDGVEVDVTVRSVWQQPPSLGPVLAGMAAGLAMAAGAAVRRFRVPGLAACVAGLAAAAAALGVVALRSVPPETGPSWALWVPPVAALVMAGGAAAARWAAPLRRWSATGALLGALLLAVWGFVHREWMWRAILPTAAPGWLERLVTGAVLVGGLGLLMLVGRAQVAGEDR